jgi:hypothetical protein
VPRGHRLSRVRNVCDHESQADNRLRKQLFGRLRRWVETVNQIGSFGVPLPDPNPFGWVSFASKAPSRLSLVWRSCGSGYLCRSSAEERVREIMRWRVAASFQTVVLMLSFIPAEVADAQTTIGDKCRTRWVYASDTYRFVPTLVTLASNRVTIAYQIEDWFIPGSPSTLPITTEYYITSQVDDGALSYLRTKLPGMAGTLGTEPVKGEMGVLGLPKSGHRVIVQLWESLTESHPIAYLSLCLGIPGQRRIDHFELDKSGEPAVAPLPR